MEKDASTVLIGTSPEFDIARAYRGSPRPITSLPYLYHTTVSEALVSHWVPPRPWGRGQRTRGSFSSLYLTVPVLLLLVYTMCFLAGGEHEKQLVKFGPYNVEITCYAYNTRGRRAQHMHTP